MLQPNDGLSLRTGHDDDYRRDTIERDEKRLAELGRKTVEMFVISQVFTERLEVRACAGGRALGCVCGRAGAAALGPQHALPLRCAALVPSAPRLASRLCGKVYASPLYLELCVHVRVAVSRAAHGRTMEVVLWCRFQAPGPAEAQYLELISYSFIA